MSQSYWRNCSSCKSEIGYSSEYYVCSVSTCKQKRTNFVFCSVPCFERHLPGARHKDAWAEQETSPSAAAAQAQQANASSDGEGRRRRIVSSSAKPSVSQQLNNDILVVVSKLKNYIKGQYDYNTSGDVMPKLSEMIRRECDKAADNARADGRKTIMARDFK